MKYPIPKNSDFFTTEKITKESIKKEKKGFSREKKNKYMETYIHEILKHKKMFQSLPRIQEIYICNSISFNKIHKKSDIDLFIICKKEHLRRARFISLIRFFFKKIKRTQKEKEMKFCLSFYITEDHKNLYNISLPKTDIYLSYRIAHLIPLYQETSPQKNIYEENKRIFSTLPNLPKKHNINIEIPIIYGASKQKKIREKYTSGIIGKILEKSIRFFRIPILLYKKQKLAEKGENIIINNNMLKFYEDKREKISLLYRLKIKG